MQEISVKKFWDNLDIRYKITFFSAMIWGVVSHGMALFQKLSFHDDNVALFGVGATYNLGRWMLGLISKFERILFGDSHYSLPVFNGFMALLLIAFSACLIVNMLEIKNEFSCALIGGLMVCFPAVTSIFGYLFTLHYYMLAMALGVLGVYCICKGNRWYCTLLGIVLMTCSLGIYQAFLPLMLSVMLLYFIHAVVTDQSGVSGIFTWIVKWVGSTIGALVLYFGFNKLFLNLTSSELSSYRGISSMGGTRPLDYLIRIFSAYREFFHPSREGVYNMYPGNVRGVFYLILLTVMIMVVILLFRLWKTQKYKAIFCGLAFLIFPLCSNFIFVMTEEKDIHSLMVYSHLMCFILFVWLIEHVKICRATIRRAFMTV